MVAELRKLAAALAMKPQLYHWRTHGGAEVDIILERDGILYPIEIKLTSRPTKNDTRGISAFRGTYSASRIAPDLVLCPVDRPLRLNDNDIALPWDAV